MSKSKNRPGRNQPPSSPSAAKPAPKSAPAPAPAPAEPTAPLFRRVDWLAFFLTTVLVMVGYVLTLAPNVTLEDSGELSVGSYYAGIPHPPGYPVWALYTWVFANFMPIGNIAWRVGFASGLAGAIACGIIALMVSRGSSLMIEGLADLKNVDRKLENALCLVSGLVSGLLMGFNGYFWSQAVIVEVYTLSVLSLVIVMACMMRWAYAPNRYRYLYWAAFVFGICFTNHQTLIVAAMGIQVLVAGVNPKLGRDAFLMNSVIFVGALLLNRMGMLANLSANGPLFVVFICIGLMSIAAFMYLWAQTRQVLTEWKVGVFCTLLWVAGAGFYFWMPIASMSTPPLNWGYPRTVEGFFHALTRGQYEKANPSNLFNDPMRFFGQLWMYADGVIEEFSLPYVALGLLPFVFVFYWKMKREELKVLLLSSAGYVALCLCIVARYFFAQKLGASQFFWGNLPQLAGMVVGLVFLWIMLTPVVIKSHAQRRESAWLAGLTGIYLGLALLLLILLNPSPDRQSKELNKVFFTSSHVMVAMGIGLGISLLGAALSLYYERIRKWFAIGAITCSAMALFVVAVTYYGDEHARDTLTGVLFELGPTAEPTARFADVLSLVLAAVTAGALLLCRARAPFKVLLLVFALLPVRSISSHWWDNEQRGHLFGYWFGHDMFTPPFKDKDGKPLYPEMDRDTVLFGGTDPGRFNPTYMIYNESFIPERCRQDEDPKFDRRDVYLITQNALADATYLMYIRAHYNRSAQKDPPFFTEFFHTQLLRPLDTLFGGIGDAIEKDRRSGSSRFKPADLLDAKGLAAKLSATDTDPLAKFINDALAPRTKEFLKSGDEAALRSALAKDLDALLERELKDRKNPDYSATPRPLYTPERFAGVKLSPRTLRFVKENPQSHTRIRLNRQLLEEAFPKEIAKSPGGVYPDLEIKTPTIEDSQQAFQEYIQDAQRRKQHDDTLPNEPRQLKPGEDVRIDNGRVQVSGQVAVMSINGLLTKVIFDKNPNHEFYVEESFPLDWMFPYLTPFGVIMKINRQPLAELTDDVCQRDHEFWSQFSSRLTGNWLTYDTPVKDVCEFAERVYLNRDLRNSKGGNPKFFRDDNAQKAFSKLRSAIGGLYSYRIGTARTPVERQRMIKEADFAFKQAFAFCPFSPEAVFRYVNLLVNSGRGSDALLVAETCKKLDPENPSISSLIDQLQGFRPTNPDLKAWNADSNNFTAGFKLAQTYMQTQRRPEALAILDSVVGNPKSDAGVVLSAAQAFYQMQDFGRLENAMRRMTVLMPASPEAWFDLTAVQAAVGKTKDALVSLESVLKLNSNRLAERANDYLVTDPGDAAKTGLKPNQTLTEKEYTEATAKLGATAFKARKPGALDMIPLVRSDGRLAALRLTPEFQKLVPPLPAPAPAPMSLPLAPQPPAAPKK